MSKTPQTLKADRRRDQLKRDAINREMSASRKAAGLTQHVTKNNQAERDWLRLVSLIPKDTRDVTARIFGDPLPGRSAFDQKQQSAQ